MNPSNNELNHLPGCIIILEQNDCNDYFCDYNKQKILSIKWLNN